MSNQLEIVTIPTAVDIHDHLRWPSPVNLSEDFESGTKSAALSGFGLLCDMPNTQGRPTWSWEEVEFKHNGVKEQAWVPMAFHAGSQLDSEAQPTNLDELEAMSKGTIGLKLYFGLTTGNESVKDINVWDYEPIVKRWHEVAPDKPILVHRGNADLEEIIAMVAIRYEHPLHVCHVNNPDEVRVVKVAKDHELPVTCGVTPHHLFKTSHEVMTSGWNKRMQPPLARQDDAEELWRMLVNGDIDIVETDHAPHPLENKRRAEVLNPHGHETSEPGATCYGVSGIEETMPQLLYQERLGRISLDRLVEVTSTKPAEIIGVRLGRHTKVSYLRELGQVQNPTSIYHGNMIGGRVLRSVIRNTLVVDDGKLVERMGLVISERGDEI